jgi:glycosyltransferase involved in cell wall biosynthesis
VVDVVIPVFNGAAFLRDCLNSVLRQTHSHLRIYVVDDGSTDDSASLVRDFAQRDSRIQLIQQENRGLSAARNAGLEAGDSDYVAFLDCDDVWLPEKIEKQLAVFLSSPFSNLGVVYSDYNAMDEQGALLGPEVGFKLDTKIRGQIFETLTLGNFVAGSGSGVLVKRECFRKCGGFDTGLKAAEDWDMWLRLARDFEFDFHPAPLLNIRFRRNSMQSDQWKMKINIIRLIGKHCDRPLSPQSRTNLKSSLKAQLSEGFRLGWWRRLYQESKSDPRVSAAIGLVGTGTRGKAWLARQVVYSSSNLRRMFQSRFFWLQLLTLSVCALVMWSYAPKAFHPSLPNDTNSAYYIGYARNLVRYPLSVTRGLNVDRVEEAGKLLHASDTVETQYKTHPPLLTWATAIFYGLGETVKSGRGVSIFGSLLTILGLAYLLFQIHKSWFAAALVAPLLFCIRVFVEHGVVVNFEPLCAGLSILLLSLFYRKQTSRNVLLTLALFAVFPLALLSDWPAYLMMPAAGYCMLRFHGFKSLMKTAAASVAVLAAIVLYYMLAGHQPGITGALIQGVLKTHMNPGAVVIFDSWPVAFKKMGGNFLYNFGTALTLLIAACVPLLMLLSRKIPQVWPPILFLTLGACLNMVLFKQWAADHSFWSYYFIAPAVLVVVSVFQLAANRISKPPLRRAFIASIALALVFVASRRVDDVWRKAHGTPAYVAVIERLKTDPGLRLHAPDNSVYFGNGYVERYYFDRQLFPGDLHATLSTGSCPGDTQALYSWSALKVSGGCPSP